MDFKIRSEYAERVFFQFFNKIQSKYYGHISLSK